MNHVTSNCAGGTRQPGLCTDRPWRWEQLCRRGPNRRTLTLEERGLDVADVLERVFEEDQHRGIHDLILVFSVCVAIEVADVSAQVFHSMQNITETSEEERQ